MKRDALESMVLRVYPTYEEAQRLVDRLSDADFPVEHVRIVGHGIDSIEQVTGRMTKGRAALAGAGAGAAIGLLFGLLFSLFVIVPAGVLLTMLGSVLIGAFWGGLFAFIAHLATGGRRDFSSISGLVAKSYTVQVDALYFDEAVRIADGI
ncbi:general stress protein [Mycolicibacterium flavescens]|nr:general stress protein [Mycolicibacterium flavescens]